VPSTSPAAPRRDASARVTGALGLILPTFPQDGTLPGADRLAALCRGAEGAGAGALWACDHLFWHGPCLEALAALGVAVAATRHAAVGTCVLQLPLRRPAAVAKQAASLDHLARGRLVLGVGAGSHPGEYAAAGVDFATRGRRLDAGIDELRGAWGRPRPAYPQLPGAGSIPVWIGGSSEGALRRAARRGDGWIPLFLPPEDYAPAMDRLDKETDRAGRDPAAVARATVVFASMGGADPGERGLAWMGSLYGLAPSSFARHLVAGDARHCAGAVARFVEAGAQHVAVFVTADDPLAQFEDLAGACAERLALRAADAAASWGSVSDALGTPMLRDERGDSVRARTL